MKLRSKLFIVTATLLTVFTFLVLSMDYRYASAQGTSDKPAATKASDKTKSDGILATFIEIGAARCIPCKAMQPIMKEIAEQYKGRVQVLFYDVWTPQGKIDAEKFDIRVIPTQVFLDKNGKEYFRHEGYFPKEELIKVLKMQGVK